MTHSVDTALSPALTQQLYACAEQRKLAKQQMPNVLKQAEMILQKLQLCVDDLRHQTKHLPSELSDWLAQQAINDGETNHSSIVLSDLVALSETLQQHTFNADVPAEVVAKSCFFHALIEALMLNDTPALARCSDAVSVSGLALDKVLYYKTECAEVMLYMGNTFSNATLLSETANVLEQEVLAQLSTDQQSQRYLIAQQLLGVAWLSLAQRQRETRNLEQAIECFKAVLAKQDQSLDWARTQNHIGSALGLLAYRRADQQLLSESAEAFESALKILSEQNVPQDTATIQNNLAAVLQSLGQQKKDPKTLKRAVETYKQILTIWTREHFPQNWAATMDNLGTALRLLGEYRKGPRTLEQSVAAYNSALVERPRQHYPQQWAMTQNNIGASLQKLAEKQGDTEAMQRAIAAYEQALTEWTQESSPMQWGMTLANLGVARRTFAQATENIAMAKQAVTELESVCDFFRHASHAQYSELGIDQLAQARSLVGALSSEQHNNE